MEKKCLECKFDEQCNLFLTNKSFLTVKTALVEAQTKRTFIFDVTITDSSVHTTDIIKVKVWNYRGWKFALSKHYWGSNQGGPYHPGHEGVPLKNGIEEVFHYAAHSLLEFIKENDKKKDRWEVNKYFKI